jgi:type II secretory pathway component GspD/PulD (secretin)
MQRIPLLSDIPFFGELFKFRSNTKQKSEIVSLSRPRGKRVGSAKAFF